MSNNSRNPFNFSDNVADTINGGKRLTVCGNTFQMVDQCQWQILVISQNTLILS